MTTLRQIELRCPVCDNEFKSQTVVSTNAFGGKRTDFHERAAGTQPLAYLIHMCSECGYSGGEGDFTAAADVSPVLKQHVLEELAPLRPALVCGSEKYEAAASERLANARSADRLSAGGSQRVPDSYGRRNAK